MHCCIKIQLFADVNPLLSAHDQIPPIVSFLRALFAVLGRFREPSDRSCVNAVDRSDARGDDVDGLGA